MNRKALKLISKIASWLPSEPYHAIQYPAKILGSEVLLSGTTEINGEKVDPEKEYFVKTPLIREVDHKMRLKNEYHKKGKVGVITYLRPYIKPEKYGEVQAFIMKSL